MSLRPCTHGYVKEGAAVRERVAEYDGRRTVLPVAIQLEDGTDSILTRIGEARIGFFSNIAYPHHPTRRYPHGRHTTIGSITCLIPIEDAHNSSMWQSRYHAFST